MQDKESNGDKDPETSGKAPGNDLFRYSAVGIEFAALVGLLVFGGWSLDQSTNPDGFPWFLLLGLAAGLGLGTWRLILQVGRDEESS